MREQNHQTSHPAVNAGARVASLPAPHERRLRGIAEARAASDLANRLVEAERGRGAEAEGVVPRADIAEYRRGGDWAPVVIGIGLGALFLFAASAVVAHLGFWR